MLAVEHHWSVIVAIVAATGAILAAVLPILLRVNKHARGAYDATNRVDEIIEPGGADSKTLNLRQMIDLLGQRVNQGFEANVKQHSDLHQGIGGLHEEVRSVRADLQAHAEDEAVHSWKRPTEDRGA